MLKRVATEDIDLPADDGSSLLNDTAGAPPRKAAPDAAPRTVRVHKGQDILMPLMLMNRDERIWEAPNEFRPERFAELCNSTSGYNSPKHGYLPFGFGTRGCIGNTLAMIESGVMLATLVEQFTFEPVPGFKPQILSGISLATKNGIRLRIARDDKSPI